MTAHPHPNQPKMTKRSLKSNPFTTYRDPKTGQWLVIKRAD